MVAHACKPSTQNSKWFSACPFAGFIFQDHRHRAHRSGIGTLGTLFAPLRSSSFQFTRTQTSTYEHSRSPPHPRGFASPGACTTQICTQLASPLPRGRLPVHSQNKQPNSHFLPDEGTCTTTDTVTAGNGFLGQQSPTRLPRG